jgi:hypothetical protein
VKWHIVIRLARVRTHPANRTRGSVVAVSCPF